MDKELVNGFLECMRQAGQVVRDQWNDPRQISFKGRIDLVTQTDLAVEKLLCERLPELLPGSTVLGEESHTSLVPGDLTWIVDPVDGTTNYAHRIPHDRRLRGPVAAGARGDGRRVSACP